MNALAVILIDGGTTHTRAWAVQGGRVLAHARVQVGAKDTARDGSTERLRGAVRDLVGEVIAGAPGFDPVLIGAAGMITSPQGLLDLPHVEAPAGAAELAAGSRQQVLPAIASVPIVFIPGVRSGPAQVDGGNVLDADFMRGEEVLALGLHEAPGPLTGGGILLNVGSHWKAIAVDPSGRISGSVSTLSGELIHAVQAQTILSSALPAGRPEALDPVWIAAGAAAALRSGLSRALYGVRLLEQRSTCNSAERQAFLTGAVIAADCPALIPPGRSHKVVISGAPAMAEAWAAVLRRDGIEATLIDDATTESAFRAGVLSVLGHVQGRPGA